MPRKRGTPHDLGLKKKARKKLLLESFEDRILCSAAVPIEPVPEAPPAAQDAAATDGNFPADSVEAAPVPAAAS
jgi:hypothetical protein